MFVLVDNLKINYREENAQNEKVITLLHGWKVDLEIWESVITSLNDYRIIRLDLPGFGKSDMPSKAWDVSDYAKFLNEFLEKLDIPKTILIGHSFGGRIAIKFSVLCPDKVSKLILVDSGGIRLKSFRIFFAFISAKLGKIFFLLPLVRVKKDEYKEKFYKAIKAGDYLEQNPILKKTFLKIIAEDLRGEAAKINSPTLIIWGEKDLITEIEEGRILANSIKNSKLEIIKNAGHFPFLEKKEEFLKYINNFIEK